jgi:hypothetical protein
MKKIVLVLVLYLFWDGPANSKIIKLECPTSHVHKPLTIELDTEKKMADKYPYIINSKNEIEFSFWLPSVNKIKKNGLDTLTGWFVKIDPKSLNWVYKTIDGITGPEISEMQKNNNFGFNKINNRGMIQSKLFPTKCISPGEKHNSNLLAQVTPEGSVTSYPLENYKVGDSLLEDAEISMIEEQKKFSQFKGRKFYNVAFELSPNESEYQYMDVYIKSGDTKYTIQSLSMVKNMNVNKCLEHQEYMKIKLDEKFSKHFFYAGQMPHDLDKSGKSIVYGKNYAFRDGNLTLNCRAWADEFKKKYKGEAPIEDAFVFTISSSDFIQWQTMGMK